MHSITRITVTLQATQALAWPHYAGSTLRGAFGRALRRAACVTGQNTCAGCPLRNSCAYGVVFDPAAPAQPLHPSFRDGLPRYLVQAPALGACQLTAGDSQTFDLLLLPGTHAHHSLIQHTLQRTVEQELMQAGLFKLLGTQTSEVPIPPFGGNPADPNNEYNHHQSTAHITLRWLSPLRLQQQGKPVFKPQQLDVPGLVRALQRRHLQWCQISRQPVPDTQAQTAAANTCTLDTRQLQWHDLQRHSGTQNQKLPLGGLMGSAVLSGPSPALKHLLSLLQLGEQLHVGKETVMGLGRYSLGSLHIG
jgi:hypothetical protein